MRRRDRVPTPAGLYRRRLAVPEVSTAITQQLQSIMEKLPSGYCIEEAGSIKEPGKTTLAIAERGYGSIFGEE